MKPDSSLHVEIKIDASAMTEPELVKKLDIIKKFLDRLKAVSTEIKAPVRKHRESASR